MTTRSLFIHPPVTASLFAAALIGLASIMSPALAAKNDINKIIGGTVACGTAYETVSDPEFPTFNNATWKFSNFNETSISIERIRVYDWDGSMFSDYQWNGSNFDQVVTGTGAGSTLPADQTGTISWNDNVLSAFQPFKYQSDHLYGAGVLPEHAGMNGLVTLVVNWNADSPVYPLVGIFIRMKQVIGEPSPDHLGELVGGLARSSHDCQMIHTVYGK